MRKGFTLIEIMVSVSIFLVVMTISMGAILSVFAANAKSQSLKAVLDNLNSSLETMSREMRFGSNYHCDVSAPTGNITSPQDCARGEWVSFLTEDGQEYAYRLNGSTLEKSVDGGVTFIPVTSPDITIDPNSFGFTVHGTNPGDVLQPKVFIRIGGTAGSKAVTQSTFNIQTLISERKLDHAS